MASKKNAIVKSDKIDDMVAAGIDVKLTKMEIADYIAAKAQEELEKRQEEIQKQRQIVPIVTFEDLTDDQQQIVQLYDKLYNDKHEKLSFGDNCYNKFLFVEYGRHIPNFSLPLTEEQQNHKSFTQARELDKEWNENREKLYKLSKKSHRTLLIEKILSGSDSGKKVLTDIHSMVKSAVNG